MAEKRETQRKEPCPLVREPLAECYCANLHSGTTEAAIHFCGEYFEECPVYRKIWERVARELREQDESDANARKTG